MRAGRPPRPRRHAADELRLDRPADAATAHADPDLALRIRRTPLLVDEWQLVPEVLGAIKRAVDDEPGSRRFVITGSSLADLTAAGWPATGRMVRVPMWGLSQRELVGNPRDPSVIDRIAADGVHALGRSPDPPDLAGYVEAALRGGFPDAALQPDPDLRRRWLDSYVNQIVARDGALVDGGRDPVRIQPLPAGLRGEHSRHRHAQDALRRC